MKIKKRENLRCLSKRAEVDLIKIAKGNDIKGKYEFFLFIVKKL